jgi:hypothetical protein
MTARFDSLPLHDFNLFTISWCVEQFLFPVFATLTRNSSAHIVLYIMVPTNGFTAGRLRCLIRKFRTPPAAPSRVHAPPFLPYLLPVRILSVQSLYPDHCALCYGRARCLVGGHGANIACDGSRDVENSRVTLRSSLSMLRIVFGAVAGLYLERTVLHSVCGYVWRHWPL